MENKSKLKIYYGIIEYLLKSTNYSLKNIADLCDTPISNIQSIYCDQILPASFTSELRLVKLYQAILQLKPTLKIKPLLNIS
ncbi:hypothetical protein [Legionella sp.]|uniref:hypothetical protein n=1 Tax=Legionella sp. TaxID=459 RepID=UPI000CC83EFB|nr:hypothetical protein [Legionella sp.]PJE14247.1 MAG: hypothetical protein CK430_05395 [Legionella sp.]